MGVSIMDKLSKKWAISDEKGQFSLPFSKEYDLDIQFLGMERVSLKGEKTSLTITLKEETLSLKEVVVTADKVKDKTSSAIILDKYAISQFQSLSLSDVLQQLPGQPIKNIALDSPKDIQLRTAIQNHLAGAKHLGAGVGDDGGLVKLAAAQRGQGVAAGDDLAAVGQGIGHMLLHFLQGGRFDERADFHAFVKAVAHAGGLHAGRELAHELVIHARLHIKAVGANAGLPRVAELAGKSALHGGGDVRIVKNNERRIAAQLQRQFFNGRCALGHEDAAHFGAAGEAEVAHDGAGAQSLAVFAAASAGDDVEHARRQPGAAGQLGHGQRRQGGEFGRLDHDGAAGGQRGGHLARDHGQRKVPGRDGRAHAHGLAQHEQALALAGGGQHLARHAPGLLGKPLHEAGAVGHFAARLGQGLALFGRY